MMRCGWEGRWADEDAPVRRSRGSRWGLQPPPSVAMEKELDGFLQLCSCLPHMLGDKRGLGVANEQL